MNKGLNSGASGLFFAEIKYNDQGQITGFGVPFEQVGLVKFESECSASTKNIYADNRVHAGLTGSESDEISLNILQMDDDFQTIVRGGYKDANGGYTFNDEPKNVAVMHIENIIDTTNSSVMRRMHIFYQAKLTADPKKKHETDEDEIKHVEFECTLKATPCDFVKDKNGKPSTYGYLDETAENKAIFDDLASAGVPIATF